MVEKMLKLATPNSFFYKLGTAIPWLMHYPLWKTKSVARRLALPEAPRHLIISIANHFEPSWNIQGENFELKIQEKRLDDWYKKAAAIGRAVKDSDGVPFSHTNFYPVEQYHESLLDKLAQMQDEGLGEVEIHLHHGVEHPDNSQNLRRSLIEARDILAEKHRLLSRMPDSEMPRYAFVHGNFALCNMDEGRNCGVDDEMQILADTGCYADLTLPAIYYASQSPRINSIYQCGRPLHEKAPYWIGPDLAVGDSPTLPILITGPLIFNWRRRRFGVPVPRIDDGALAANYPLDLERLRCWRDIGIGIQGRPEWAFIKLYCHGFFDYDTEAVIGEPIRRSLSELMEHSERSGEFKIHFASARETFNIALAAIEGNTGDPNQYRDYKLRPIMRHKTSKDWDQAVIASASKNAVAIT